MKFCPNCGHQVSEDMRFCTECGQKLTEPTRKTEPHSAHKLFNQANERWHQRQRFLLDGDEEQATNACAEVIRLCQLSIEADQRMGDAYIMLANALSVAASRVPRKVDAEPYEFLLSRAAAVIHCWYLLPHRGYPTTNNTAIGEQLWRDIFDEVKDYYALTEDAAQVLMGSYRDSLAAEVISHAGFQEIQGVIMQQLFEKAKTQVCKIAVACRINASEMLSEIAKSMQAASNVAKTRRSRDETWLLWWHTFFREWSSKCFFRWFARCGDSKDYQAMQNLWLQSFEPLWVAGCDVARIERLNGLRKIPWQFISSPPESATQAGEEAMWQYLDSMDEWFRKAIDIFKDTLRTVFVRTLKDLKAYDKDSPIGRQKRFMSVFQDVTGQERKG
jgi:hypothetical protein